MNDKETYIFYKTINSFYRSPQEHNKTAYTYTNTSYIFGAGVLEWNHPNKTYNPEAHWFGAHDWTNGIITELASRASDSQPGTLKINTDETGDVISIMPKGDQRKIIHNIKISLDKHTYRGSHDYVSFSIVQIKKNIV